MALLGAQLVITLVMVSMIQKISPYFSFARWILCSTGLIRYLYPTDQQLKNIAGIPKEKPKKGKHTENGKSAGTFHVPRNLDITLETAKVSQLDVIHLKYYTEFQWLLDFSIYATITYSLTEVYNYFYPIVDEMNLSMLWCMLVLGFAFKMLVTLWVQYFKGGEESVGERSTCIVAGFAYLFVAMIVLIIDENILEIGLDKAYVSFNHSASVFLGNQGLSSTGPASQIVLKFFLALWCGLLGSLFTFPGLRMSKMYWDSIKYYKDSKFLILMSNISFASPLFLVCLWIKPISRDYLTVRVFSGMEQPLMSSAAFDSMRLISVVVVVLLKLALMPMYLQLYLNLANQRLENQKKEAGRIINTELQKKIAAVFYYVCVVTLQYVAPLMICLFFTYMYKTLGGFTWNGMFTDVLPDECSIDEESQISTSSEEVFDSSEKSVIQTAEELQLALSSLKQIFTTDVLRGVFGLATWWSCFTLFATNAMGMLYQSYFADA